MENLLCKRNDLVLRVSIFVHSDQLGLCLVLVKVEYLEN